MTGHHKMLLLSVPVATDYQRESRRLLQARGAAQAWPIDPSIATKLWHMACVGEWGCSGDKAAVLERGSRGWWRFSRLNFAHYAAARDFFRGANVLHARM
jgi:hypothetical protein